MLVCGAPGEWVGGVRWLCGGSRRIGSSGAGHVFLLFCVEFLNAARRCVAVCVRLELCGRGGRVAVVGAVG